MSRECCFSPIRISAPVEHVEQPDDTPRRPPTQKSLPCGNAGTTYYSVAKRLAHRASHASGPFRNSQSRNAMSNTAPPTIKTIHSSGVIGRFTDQQHTPGLATSRAINFCPRPAAVERARVHAWMHCTVFSDPHQSVLKSVAAALALASKSNRLICR